MYMALISIHYEIIYEFSSVWNKYTKIWSNIWLLWNPRSKKEQLRISEGLIINQTF